MSTQPNALRIADTLAYQSVTVQDIYHAACELRAQHELIQTLKAALNNYVDGCSLSVDAGSVARAALAAAEAHK